MLPWWLRALRQLELSSEPLEVRSFLISIQIIFIPRLYFSFGLDRVFIGAAIAASPALVGCNSAFGVCEAACVAALIAPTLWSESLTEVLLILKIFDSDNYQKCTNFNAFHWSYWLKCDSLWIKQDLFVNKRTHFIEFS